ncbi:uncharacterized protein LOC135469142 [Liolophura sinensis]|uniref:uncharacterized protein LOC135469142 n=1 Tax=Liolophura sinensis TaxID=3198878 RepID=UPI003158B4A3
MKSKAEMGLKICVLSALVVVALGKGPPAKERCVNRTKRYTRTINIPERVCRYVPSVPFAWLREGHRHQSPRPSLSTTYKVRDNKLIAKELMKSFPGLFLDKKTANELNTKLKKESIRPGKPVRPVNPAIRPEIEKGIRPEKFPNVEHDGDLHCPTFRELSQAPSNLMNINSESRDIVHFDSEDVYQYVHKGICGSSSTQSCNGGSCLQEKSIVYLMVWKDDPDWPTGFEPFEVDSYCSCKSISP